MDGGTRIERVRVRGFRSLADVELDDLPRAAVLIGANGTGKSNFIRFFELLSWMLKTRRLDEFVQKQGGADDQLHGGNRTTRRMEAEVSIRTDVGMNDYRFALSHAHPDRLFFVEERFRFSWGDHPDDFPWQYLKTGGEDAEIVRAAQAGVYPGVQVKKARVIVHLLRDCSVYQFHDTSDESNLKKRWQADDNSYLRSHGGNLAAVLLRLEREDVDRYELICEQLGRILPGFDRFELEESFGKVPLRWKAKGTDKTFGAHLTSDGSLRFFALVTLLNLPAEMLPSVLFLDEPELGLHPAAITLVGGMIRSLSEERQLVVATQSPLLVDAFDLEEIYVLELRQGRTVARKRSSDEYQVWLDEDFTPGELWQKNLLGGRP